MKFSRPTKLPRGRIVKSESIPAPIKGLNTRDPLAAMDPMHAIQLTNFVCTPQGLAVREGYREYASGMPGTVRTLMAYRAPLSSNNRMFAFSGGNVYDITAGGAVGAPVVSGLTGTDVETVTLTATGTTFLIAATGSDAVRHYNGSSWVTWTNVAPASPAAPGEITGVNPATLRGPVVHQRRLWFVQKNSSSAYYFPVNSAGGAAVEFNFGPLFSRGGSLQALATWSPDSGTGMQNQLVAVSSVGDIVIYEGTDPSSPSTWRLAGVWQAGAPVGNRCFLEYGPDVLYLSQDGLLPLSVYLRAESASAAITDVIRPTITELVVSQGALQGWQLHNVFRKNLILINVPQADPTANLQLVLNTTTGGWSLFSGIEAQHWLSYNNNEYFAGTGGKVYQGFFGYRDKASTTGTGGNPYVSTAQSAFNYFEDRARQKRFTMARPNLLSTTTAPLVNVSVNTDFNINYVDTVISTPPVSASTWDASLWDAALWAGGLVNFNVWQSANGVGYAQSTALTIGVKSETYWLATDLVYEVGGMVG